MSVSDSVREVAELVSRAFLSSPIFAGIDAVRYQPEAIETKLANGRTLLAMEQDQVVGSVTLFSPNPSSPCEAFRDSPQFGLLAVEPSHGAKGVGRRLVGAAEDLVAGEGYRHMTLSVTTRGAELISFYRRLGYEDIARFHWPEAVDPSLILRKPLRSDRA